MTAMPTGTVAFLFTDIEGSTKRWQRDAQAMAGAVSRHDDLMRAAIAAHGGHVFKTVGDAFCAAFATVPAALAAALHSQRALAVEPWGEPGPIRVRMAVHVGAAEERDEDYFGPAVNRAARLLSAGHGGQVLLSLPASELVRDGLPQDVRLLDMGEHRLKDLDRAERIFQAAGPGLETDFPPLSTLDHRPNNLPEFLTPFLGRERESAELRARINRADVRLVTLTGPGGTGKTRLSLQVAAEAIDAFEDGAWFVALETATDEATVAMAIAQAVGAREGEGRTAFESVVEYLHTKRLVLVLDNFEQVAHVAPLVATLLAGAPGIKVLVSSRIRLGVRGEHEYAVPPLGLPPITRRAIPLDRLVEYEAIRLFVDRAQAAKTGFALTEENADAVVAICRALDGLPLALELAAARIRTLPPQAMLRRLSDALGLLAGGGHDLPERQQTLRGAIAWSHGLLPPAAGVVFGRLAVFAGGCTLEAAEAVVNPGGDLDVFGSIEILVDHSLVRQHEMPDGEPRFSMLDTIRAYARDDLAARGGGEAELIGMLLAEYFLALAEEAEPHLRGAEQAMWLDRLEADHDNLRGALAWFAKEGDAVEGLRLGAALWRFWHVRGYLTEGRTWLEHFNDVSSRASPDLRAKAIDGMGILAHYQGAYEEARRAHETALELYKEAGDRRGMALALNNLGAVERSRGAYDRARGSYEAALALAQDVSDARVEATMINNLGALAWSEGDYARAANLYRDGLALGRRIGDRHLTAVMLANLAEVQQLRGESEDAAATYEQALPLLRAMGDKRAIAFALGGLGRVALDRGDAAEAARYLAEQLELNEELRHKSAIADSLESLAEVALSRRQLASAVTLYGAAEAQREEIGANLPAAAYQTHERALGELRESLDAGAFSAAWSHGYARPVVDTVQDVLRGHQV